MWYIDELNEDQLDGLADLSFGLAKASFVFFVIPATRKSILEMAIVLIAGFAFIYVALLLLKLKKQLR